MANLGGSLLVPCVQELAKKTIAVVPSRYIRPEQEAPIISDDALISEIPVIDMQSLLSGELENSELAKLDFACKEWGFFQVTSFFRVLFSPEHVLDLIFFPSFVGKD